AVVAPRDAAFAERPRFVAVGAAIGRARLRRRRTEARVFGERGNLAVGRIDHERRAQAVDALDVVLALPERVVVVDVVGGLRPESLVARFHERRGFFGREELLVRELRGTLERGVRRVRPVAGQIRRAIRGARRLVPLRNERERSEGNGGDRRNYDTHPSLQSTLAELYG